jgi:hypothetical protein
MNQITIIAKNTTGATITLSDMGGFTIEALGQETLSNYFRSHQITASEDLASNVSSGDVVINDGSDDLSISLALEYLQLTTRYFIKDSFIDLDDTPDDYVGKEANLVRARATEGDLVFLHKDELGYATTSGTLNVNRISFASGELFLDPASNKNPHIAGIGPIAGYAFDDRREEMVYGSFILPPAFPPSYDMHIHIYYANDATQTGGKVCRWGIEYQTYTNGQLYANKTSTTITDNHSLPTDATQGTMMLNSVIVMDENDANNPLTAGSLIVYRFFRDSTNVADTMDGDGILSNLTFEAT